jgi:hypothetical protein
LTTPYTDDFPRVVAAAGQSIAAALTALHWSRPLRTRTATVLFVVAIWTAVLAPNAPAVAGLLHLDPSPRDLSLLQLSATLAIVAMLLDGSRWLGVLAALGQFALFAVAHAVRDSNYELSFAYIFFYGVLVGTHALRNAAPDRSLSPPARRSFGWQDGAIFLVTTGLALLVTNLVFGRVVFNGDEVANSFQADVYGHLRAFAPIPPCPSMFENYWVFRHNGHAFSQYTPGWPMFMAAFQRAGVIWLAGPVMGGLLAVGIARLSRRVASGLGRTADDSGRIVAVAGWLGPILAALGPALLLNSASRFSHTMVCGCFAWAVESLCVVSEKGPGSAGTGPPEASRARAWRYGLLLGAATSLGLATRPADGGMLGVGIFLYFAWAAFQRRITRPGFLGTAVGFLFFGGLTAIILRLQLGAWFQTGYAISASIHPEAHLHLSWPEPNQIKYGIPLATGSYCWWPIAPALGVAGLLRALGGRQRGAVFMLVIGALMLWGFYFLVEFGRGGDDGLGPRYLLPLVVPMAIGTAAILAPLFASVRLRGSGWTTRLGSIGPAFLAALAVAYGVARIAPALYPVAFAEYRNGTAPLRGAKRLGLKNAIVMLEPGHIPVHETNLAQNPPMNPSPDVLFLIRRNPADDACARENFPGRTWYRAGMTETLTPY